MKADAAKTGCITQAREEGCSDLQNKISIRVNIFLPKPTCLVGQRWVKKRYPLLFRKYEIYKGQHLYRTQKKAGKQYSVPAG